MKSILVYAIYLFCNILVGALFVRAILSWFANDPYSLIGKVYGFFVRFTEPLVHPCRKLLSRFQTGMLDFSLLLAMLGVELIGNILTRLIVMFF